MKTIRKPSQQRLFDPFEGVIGASGRRQIENGWQSLFREVILEQMPVEKIGKDLHDNGRPTFELHAIIGLLLIRDLKGWTVPETHEAILFRSDIQYALNLEPGVEVTQRTIERYLARMQNDETISEELFARVTDTLLVSMEVKVKKQRLDSTHVLSDMSNMGRARMIGIGLKRLFAKIQKHDHSLLDRFDAELLKRYRKQSDSQVFGDVRTTEQRQVALQQAAEDLHEVLQSLAEVDPVCQWELFTNLQKVFVQQCELREEFIEVRKKTGGHVIQNVSDPDATYCGNKGAGYQVQISETFNDQGAPNFITAAKVETAADSDAHAVLPVLEDLKQRDILPEELLADAGYGGDANVRLSAEESVELIAPVPGGKKYNKDEIRWDEFELNKDNEVVACPAGHAPKSTSFSEKSQQVWAKIDPALCRGCSLLEHCKVQRDTKTKRPNGRVQFQLSELRAAERRKKEQTDEYRDRYRWRSGIEATNSSLKRTMRLGRLRVRGMKAVKLALLLKLAGWNILRAAAMRALKRSKAKMAII